MEKEAEMKNNLLEWDMYEIFSDTIALHGVKCRGKLRKCALLNNINLLAENAQDKENTVRFVVLKGEDISFLQEFINKTFSNPSLSKVGTFYNPILSKLKSNDEARYTI